MVSGSIGYAILWLKGGGAPHLCDFTPQWAGSRFVRSEVSWVPLLGVCLPAVAPPAKLVLFLTVVAREDTAEDARLPHLPFNL